MPRKPHPADAFNAGIVATATAWSAFTQAAGRITRHFKTEADALRAAQVMADGFHRPALVYAIDAQGRTAVAHTVHPSNSQQSKESTMSETTTKTYPKRFNAQRAARKLLGEVAQEGEAFRTFKAPNGEWDFETLGAPAEQTAEEEFSPPAFLSKAGTADNDEPATTAPASIDIADLTPEGHPIAAANAASWPKSSKRQKNKGHSAAEAEPAKPASGKRASVEEAARQGNLPTPPDFSAMTHARFRAKLAKLVELAEAGDAEGLKAFAINPVSTSPRAMARYRDLAVLAIEARAAIAA